MDDYHKKIIANANRYNKANYTQISFRVRKDDPIIQHLKKQDSMAQYIANLIREDMKKKGE